LSGCSVGSRKRRFGTRYDTLAAIIEAVVTLVGIKKDVHAAFLDNP
jgi:hypothetical protein